MYCNFVNIFQFPGMYCMDGDIAGATTILEHMKQVKIFTLSKCLSHKKNYDTERTSILLSSV
jgi:hypothetical protein